MSNESSRKTPKELGWTEQQSKSQGRKYYECKTLPGGYKSQFEVPKITCPKEGVTLRTPATSATPATVSLIGANNKAVTYKVVKIGGKRTQKKKYGKKTRKLRKKKNKQ